MNLVYQGPSHAVNVVGLGEVTRGVPFEVADELGTSLLEQDIFKTVPVKKAPKGSKSEPIIADPAASSETSEEG